MSLTLLNIRGRVIQGGVSVTSGFVRAKNLDKSIVKAVAIGTLNDGTPASGMYDIWFMTEGGNVAVADIGDRIELSVYSPQSGATVESLEQLSVPFTPLFQAQTVTLTVNNVSGSTPAYLGYDITASLNLLPDAVDISSCTTENRAYQYVSNPTVVWTWKCPRDPDNDPVHFQLDYANNATFGSATTCKTLGVGGAPSPQLGMFQVEVGGYWEAFPSTGLSSDLYGARVRFTVTLPADGTYYWRVRATDGIER